MRHRRKLSASPRSGDGLGPATLFFQLRAGDRVLRVKELSKTYGEKPLWSNIALDISRGERIGIIGSNGSGKTTLLNRILTEQHGKRRRG